MMCGPDRVEDRAAAVALERLLPHGVADPDLGAVVLESGGEEVARGGMAGDEVGSSVGEPVVAAAERVDPPAVVGDEDAAVAADPDLAVRRRPGP